MREGRLTSIDTVRGVAVLGILVMNIIGFAYGGAAYLNPTYTGGAEGLNLALWSVANVTVDGKMRALFAMLFGASMLLMAESSPAGTEWSRHAARMAVLFVFGMLHASLLWSGDILLPFAIVGMLVFPLRKLAPQRLFLLGVIALGIQAGISVAFGMQAISAEAAANAPGASAAAVESWKSIGSVTISDSADIARETAMYRGSLGDILAIRHEAVMFMRLFVFPFVFLVETIGLMLIGMGLYRLGWWQGDFARGQYVRVAAVLISAGWAAGAILCALFISYDFSPAAFYLVDAGRVLIGPLVAIGYAALLIILVKSGKLPGVVSRLAACGRMALSNYLSASVLANLVFTGIGLSLYGELSRIQVYGVVAAIWALQLAWSKPWLERFRFGPFEWVWRSLARWQRQPMQPPAYRVSAAQ